MSGFARFSSCPAKEVPPLKTIQVAAKFKNRVTSEIVNGIRNAVANLETTAFFLSTFVNKML